MLVPTRDEIFKHFQLMGEGKYTEFFELIDDNVEWTIMGTILSEDPCGRTDWN